MGAADIVSLVTELGPIATAAISQEAEPAGELLQTLVKEYRLNSDPRLLEEIMHVLIGEAVAGVSGWRSRIRDARSAIGVESAGSDAERGFDSALNCLTAVQAGRPMPAWPIPQSGGSDVERIAISLWILLAPVHFGIGALDPRRLKHARDAISGESPPTEDDRTGHVVRFAKHHAAVYLRQCGYPQEDEGEQPVPQFAIDLGRLVTNISGTRGRQ